MAVTKVIMATTIHSTIDELNRCLQNASAEDVLTWSASTFGDQVALACSFGAEDVVLVHLISSLDLKIPIFVLDTGRLHEETYDVMNRIREKYRATFEVFSPQSEPLQNLIRLKGPQSFYESVENRRECCGVRKVEPLSRALKERKAWITGLRQGQSVTRVGLSKVEIDEAHDGILKLSPLVDWTEQQIWEFIRANDIPYNSLHDKGFPSIGCAPCTRATVPGEDIRAGRWWWEQPEHKECGLHSRQPSH